MIKTIKAGKNVKKPEGLGWVSAIPAAVVMVAGCVAWLGLLSLCTGCGNSLNRLKGIGRPKTAQPAYELQNIYKAPEKAQLGRVVLLPVVLPAELAVPESREAIRAAVAGELMKTKEFEVVALSPDEMAEWAGVKELTSLDTWPHQLRKSLEAHEVDGVMLVEITRLKGYPPLALGMKARLVERPTGKTLWAVDELLDAADPGVFAAAKKFESATITKVGKAESPGTVEISLTLFAKYAAWAVFETLP